MQRSFAKIDFQPDGTPVAKDFDDVYFSKHDGAEETRYVFIQNNQLPERWQDHSRGHFVIAETGFGTGLNFLLTAEAFLQFRRQHPHSAVKQLNFVTTEKFPLSPEDWQQALQPFKELQLANWLLAQKLVHIDGCHRFEYAEGNTRIVLDLWLGDVLSALPSMNQGSGGVVDAWFLDGFAPSKNQTMWQPELFRHMARLSQANATFATFTAAGFVRRGLQVAGFEVEKRKGFGRKRDMLAGTLSDEAYHRYQLSETPYWNLTPLTRKTPEDLHIVIVGGGISAACAAYALAKRSIKVTVITKADTLADAASGNPQAAVYPQLNAKASMLSLVQLNSFLYAKRLYQELSERGFDFANAWPGVLQLGFSDVVQQRQENLLKQSVWPEDVIHGVDAESAAQLAGIDLPYSGLFIPLAGWLSPPELVTAMFDAAAQMTHINMVFNGEYIAHQTNRGITSVHYIRDGQSTQIDCDAVVLASGHSAATIPHSEDIPMTLTRGQVESIPAQAPLSELKTVLCHKGYLTPALNGRHALGSTYVKQDLDTGVRAAETQTNRQTHMRCLNACDWAESLPESASARAAVRCFTCR